MNNWQELEIKWAKALRESNVTERKQLFAEAYSAVAEARMSTMPGEPEKRTAGTSNALVKSLLRLCDSHQRILEVGCGRGYTCLKMAPHVASIVGLDVSDPALNEARGLLKVNQIKNVEIRKGFADKLRSYFCEETFDKVISIDVYEHLHPEDAIMHLSEAYSVLKTKGEIIVVTPNRLTGPHDMTKDVFPDAREPLGFHLNETDYTELIKKMRTVGFNKFRSVIPLSFYSPISINIVFPSIFSVFIERQYQEKTSLLMKFHNILISTIFLIATKS